MGHIGTQEMNRQTDRHTISLMHWDPIGSNNTHFWQKSLRNHVICYVFFSFLFVQGILKNIDSDMEVVTDR